MTDQTKQATHAPMVIGGYIVDGNGLNAHILAVPDNVDPYAERLIGMFNTILAENDALVAALRDALSIMERSPKFKRANHPTYAEARCKAIDDARAALKAAEGQS